MSLLLFDGGNSRLKWALMREPYRRGSAFAAGGALDPRHLHGRRSVLRALLQALAQSGLSPRLYACNVAGPAIAAALVAATERSGLGKPRFVRTGTAACGVRNGYREAWRLGADRWVGMIGAHHEHPNMDLCIVSIGTAMTIDVLDASGRHVGGSIIPGPRLMIDALLARTAGIRRRAGGRQAIDEFEYEHARAGAGTRLPLFAHDTRGALVAGARHACAAAIEHARREAGQQLGRRPRLLIAGGAMDFIAPLLDSPHRREDDLILRGLAVIASTRAPHIA
jgi:type III pantothenate kinase